MSTPEESLNGQLLAIVPNGKSAPIVANLADGKLLPIVIEKPNGKMLPNETVDRLPSLVDTIEAEIDDLPRRNHQYVELIPSMVKSVQSSVVKNKRKSSKDNYRPAKRPNTRRKAKKTTTPNKPETGTEKAARLNTPKANAKRKATNKAKKLKRAKEKAAAKKKRANKAIATGGRVSKTGRIYEAASIANKSEAMKLVTIQRLEDEAAKGLCVSRNLVSGTSLKDPDKHRSLCEDLFSTFMSWHKDSIGYTALYYPERDYPDDCHDWSIRPYGKPIPWVRDFDLLISSATDESDLSYQFQCKGLGFYPDLKKALQHRVSIQTSKKLFLGIRKDLYDLLLRHQTNHFALKYCDDTEIVRKIQYISYTSVNHWVKQGYRLSGQGVYKLIKKETERFHQYYMDFFEAVFPLQHMVLLYAIDDFQDYSSSEPLTSKMVAIEFGKKLVEVKELYEAEETEETMHQEWSDAREHGFNVLKLKLPPIYKPTNPAKSSINYFSGY